jgi:undecaprenyl-diphosphatase
VILAALALLSLPLGAMGYRYAGGNVHEVEPGVLYRSGQLGDAGLRAIVAEKGIRTILNLRGAHPDEDWYRREAAVARDAGIDYRSIAISARSVPDMATMVEIATTLAQAPRPILVHCIGGSDRSGLASAIYELAVEGSSEADAAGQLSIAYGHFPWLGSKTVAMDRAFVEFADYWRNERRQLVAAE